MFNKNIRFITAITILMGFFVLLGCQGENLNLHSTDLMSEVVRQEVNQVELTDEFTLSQANFAVSLLQATISEENTLISPTSVTQVLAMVANGANGQTLHEMSTMIGGSLTMSQLNQYLYSQRVNLPSIDRSLLNINNSIWIREGFAVLPSFLQTNANYFGSDAYSAPFNNTTVNDINNWVKYHTDGMIEEVIQQIHPLDMMFLVNTVMFDARWQNVFYTHEIRENTFTNLDGSQVTTKFMTKGGHDALRTFLSDDYATGFLKPYYGNHYSFLAMLPNEGVCILDYVNSLTGTSFIDILANQETLSVLASMPSFEFDFDQRLNDALINMGMPTAFSPTDADFTNMFARNDGPNLFLGFVDHFTYISVDAEGTRAGAATIGGMQIESAPFIEREVILNRPFMFAIIDNVTNLPIFIGILTNF